MDVTISGFPELVEIIDTHPEWRRQLVNVLFPDIDLAQSMRELKQSLNRLEERADEAAEDRRQMTVRLDVLHQDVATIKGLSYEHTIRDIATGIFGLFIRRGKDAKGKISVQLYEAVTAGKISEHEFTQVMAIDLLWSGLLHLFGLKVVLAIEALWRAELNDIERAVTRANILRKIEIKALPVVAGNIWDDQMIDLAIERGVVIVDTKQVNKDTWNLALRDCEL